MSTLYLIRHAQTLPDYGQPTAHWLLSDEGRRQAEAVARLPFWNEVSRIFSSPEQKAIDTIAPAAAQFRLEVITVAGLRELERLPAFVADYETAVAACFASPQESVQGWESAARARQRIVATIARLEAEAGDQPIAVVSHGLVLSLFLAHLQGTAAPTLPEWKSIPMPGWAAVDLSKNRVVEPFAPVL